MNKNEMLQDRENISELVQRFVVKLSPEKIYLFGSFADGSYSDDSDYDFFIVVDDGRDLMEMSMDARKAIRGIKRRPVDIVVGTAAGFEQRKHGCTVENEVLNRGVVLYDRSVGGKVDEICGR